jgi:hypothetical protein
MEKILIGFAVGNICGAALYHFLAEWVVDRYIYKKFKSNPQRTRQVCTGVLDEILHDDEWFTPKKKGQK